MSQSRKWWIVALLALGMVIAYVDRANLSAVLGMHNFGSWLALELAQARARRDWFAALAETCG